MEKTEPQPMTEAEITQANIEAWLIIRNTAWNQFLTALKQLALLGAKQNLCEFVKSIDKIRKSHYTEH